MRRLSTLCRKLRRIGVNVSVESPCRGAYFVHLRIGSDYFRLPYDGASFVSVRGCEQYLLTLFR